MIHTYIIPGVSKVVARNLKKAMLKKMWKPQTLLFPANCSKLVAGNSNVLWPGYHYQNLILSTAGDRPWLPILISHLFQHGFFWFLPTTFFIPGCFVGISFLFYFFFLVFLLKFWIVITWNSVLANVVVNYVKPISRHDNTALIHVLNYCVYCKSGNVRG